MLLTITYTRQNTTELGYLLYKNPYRPQMFELNHGKVYMLEGNLERLKKRSLTKKRHLALNEFALGMESLERFARSEPLYRVHECVFGVLALESEPVDPRL